MANFVRHINCEKCGSSDANALYDDDSQYCFACNTVVRSTSASAANAVTREKKIMTSEDIKHMTDQTKDSLDMDEYEEIKAITTTKPGGFRGIRDDTNTKFGVRYFVEDGQITKQYCPVTEDSQLVGLKIRTIPKSFSTIGRVGKKSDLFMQFRFTKGGKYLLITEGECFLPTTKVLTKSGWISLKDYEDGEVMQGDGTFATPIAKIHKQYSGNLINYKSGSYKITTTPEHNMIRIINNAHVKVKANDITKKYYPIPRTVNYDSYLTEKEELMARLQVMFSADFTFREHGDIYGCLKKQRKIDRCVQLLNASGVRYSHNKDSRGYSSFFIHRNHGLDVSKEFKYERDLIKASIIIDEIVHWDGNTVPNRNQIEYSSVILHNAEFIQTCAHICGYVSTIIPRTRDKYNWYKVSILFNKQTSTTQKGYTEINYEGDVYCLTMPSGSLLVNEDNSISISGNCDALSAYQMLNDYNASKNSPFETAVVSPVIGANSAAQLKHNYRFLDSFDQIILCYDNDKAGQEAIEDVIPSLPKGKIKIMKMRYKDANEYLVAGKEKEFVTDFYNAETYVPVGVLGSSQLYDKILAQALTQKVEFPPFMSKLNDKLVGGMPLGHIINIGAKTGIGKCLGKDTKVRMYDLSVKNVQDIVDGDLVMGADGTSRKVVGVTSGIDKLYKITQKKRMSYVVNSAHILSLRQSANTIHRNRNDVLNINVEDYLSLDVTQQRLLKGYKSSMSNYLEVDDSIYTEDDAYMLGLWLAEGTTARPQITLANKDIELKDFLFDYCAKNNYKIHVNPTGYRKNCTMYDISGGFLTLLRDKFGVYNEKHIPRSFFDASNTKIRMALLAGIIDGDGHSHQYGYELTLKKNRLSKDVVLLLQILGLAVNVKDKFSKCQGFDGDYYDRMYIYGSTDRIPNKLLRKKNSRRRINKNEFNTGITVKYIGEGEYFGFELEGKDKLFCLEDFTVTHNTTLVNELVYHWVMNSPYKAGVVSMELDSGQYGEVLLSRHLSSKLALMRSNEDKNAFLSNDIIKKRASELFTDSNGNDRFFVLDNRDGSVEEIQNTIEELIISCGCRIIILDPLQDILAGLSVDEQELFMKWVKGSIKSHGVTFILINHMRKSQGPAHAIDEEDFQGSSTIIKSASVNIILSRDKSSDDDVERNTTRITVTKNRITGLTGPAGEVYYDNDSHTLHDIDEFFTDRHKH